jgi:hypothetical protein
MTSSASCASRSIRPSLRDAASTSVAESVASRSRSLSFVAFQHIPRKRGEALFDALLARLAPNGVGVLHFTYATRDSRLRRFAQWVRGHVPLVHNLINVAQRKPFGFPHMQMNCYDVDELLRHLQERGCHRVHVRFTDHGQHSGVVLFFMRADAPEL